MENNGTNHSNYKVVYAVQKGRGDKSIWTRVGAAFPNKKTMRLVLNFIPTDPNIDLVIMDPKPREDEQPSDQDFND